MRLLIFIPVIALIISLIALTLSVQAHGNYETVGYVWYQQPGTGKYIQAATIHVADPAVECGIQWLACIGEDTAGKVVIYADDFHAFDTKGCTVQTHEWLHLMGLSESEIPICYDWEREYMGRR